MSYSTGRRDNEPDYYPLTYTHPDGQVTNYDLQEIRHDDGRPPSYILSESPDNTGPGFDDPKTRYAVANEGAQAALYLNDPEYFPEVDRKLQTSEIDLYQQRPDGNFDRVAFESARNHGSNVDIEMQQNAPELYAVYKQEREQEASRQTAVFAEGNRETYTREQVEQRVDAPLYAAEQTPQQQYQAMQGQQWSEMSGPSIDRAAEVRADQSVQAEQAAQEQARAQEQSAQMNQHQEQQTYSQRY